MPRASPTISDDGLSGADDESFGPWARAADGPLYARGGVSAAASG